MNDENSFCNDYRSDSENSMSQPKKKYDKELIMSLMNFIEDSLKKKLNEIESLVKKNNTDLKKVKKDTKSATSIITAYHQAHNTKLLTDDIRFFFTLVKENKSAKAISITPKKQCTRVPIAQTKNTSPFKRKAPAINYKSGKIDVSNVSSRLHQNTKSVDSKRNEKFMSRSNSVSCVSNYTPKKSQQTTPTKDFNNNIKRRGPCFDEINISSSENEQKPIKKKVAAKNSERYVNSTYTVSNRSKWFEENVLSQNDKKNQNNTPVKQNVFKKNVYGYAIQNVIPSSIKKSNSKRNYLEDQDQIKKTNSAIKRNETNYKIVGNIVPKILNLDKKQNSNNSSKKIYDKENLHPNYNNSDLMTKIQSSENENCQFNNNILLNEFSNPVLKNEKIKFVDSTEEKFFARMCGNFGSPRVDSKETEELQRNSINLLPKQQSPKKKPTAYESNDNQNSNKKQLSSLNNINNPNKVKSNQESKKNEIVQKTQIDCQIKYESNCSQDTDKPIDHLTNSKKFYDSENDLNSMEEHKIVSDEDRYSNDEKLWREMELERQNIVKMIESEFFTSQDTKETCNRDKHTSSRVSKDSINKNHQQFSINDSFNNKFSGSNDNIYDDKLNVDSANMRKKNSTENHEFEKIFKLQESPIRNEEEFKLENFNEQSFNYEKELNSDKFADSKNKITPLISFNYDYENKCNMKKAASEPNAHFDSDFKSDLLKKFKRTEFAQEIDYNNFKKSLDIILKMK